MTRTRDENRVRIRREQLGMQLTDLARAIDRSAAMVSNVEGGFVPQHDRRLQIAKVLQTTPDVLWPGEYA